MSLRLAKTSASAIRKLIGSQLRTLHHTHPPQYNSAHAVTIK